MKHGFISSIVLIVLCLTTGLSSPQAAELSPSDKGWIEKSDEGEFKTYYRDAKGGGTREVLMLGILNAPPEKCFGVVGEYEQFPDFMPYIHYTMRVNSAKVDDNKTLNYVFFFLSPPIVSYRYYTLQLTDERAVDGKANTFRSKWTLEKGQYHKTPQDPEIKPHLKKGWDDAVETPVNEGFWLFEPEEGGTKTKVTYYVWTNPGGSIPLWLANKANTVALPDLWSALKKRLKIQ